ncbi:DUF2182 domain-containing protein [Mesorhizobium sp. YC-39]|uniref:DUF2182 domain-containing protein n=1 Tax=unclassified Mesorhizobium TaxID=325217 RepID=UPI0021E7DA08|nr:MULTISPECIES: DUF2182 domain-containing protein [unclassified Mesorhizobium]MCV3208828.1 DUF2182 domain-containing protein [Mesorhizobium sp. YC-2]MCV3231823.1 DUF2182 domain-containing protein [Mesorhizobium sp. YC-39]
MTTQRLFLPLGVLALAGVSLLVLQFGQTAGWIQHGARPPLLPVLNWGVLFVASWTLMTGAMMLPSSVPFLRAADRLAGTAVLLGAGLGFTLAWVAAGAAIWAMLWITSPLLAGLRPGQAEWIAGATLTLAALYQLSPVANSCQQACAQPFGVIARHWRGESKLSESVVAGLDYGAHCIGCCIPMIALMLVVGMSDVFWIVALGVLMIALKHPAIGPWLRLPLAGVLAGMGIAIAVGAWTVPLHALRLLCSS